MSDLSRVRLTLQVDVELERVDYDGEDGSYLTLGTIREIGAEVQGSRDLLDYIEQTEDLDYNGELTAALLDILRRKAWGDNERLEVQK